MREDHEAHDAWVAEQERISVAQRQQELDDKIAKLPVWARTEIHRLNRDLDEWRRRATAGPEDSDTFVIGPAFREAEDTPLGRRPRIRFVLPGGAVEARVTDDAVEVMADPRMLLAPRGNAITITVVPR